ncbi:Uncharacterised protein [Legionella pneumophila]|nr:Uncharacterised protein [Legionella pneumophila]
MNKFQDVPFLLCIIAEKNSGLFNPIDANI